MKKTALILMMAALVASCRSRETFCFVQMSDTQIGFIDHSPNYEHSDSLLKAAVAGINALKPILVVATGDLVNQPDIPRQDSVYRSGMAGIEAPLYEVPGNHDMLPYSRESREAYLRLRGSDRFSVRKKGCAFIGLDSNCIKEGDTAIEEEQKAWLTKELENAAGSRHIFIFLHCPVVRESRDEAEDYFNFPIPKRETYMRLFKQFGVSAVFAGHTHQEYATQIDGIGYYAAGPVGNALGRGRPGYNVITVGKDGVKVEYVPTPGIDPAHCVF